MIKFAEDIQLFSTFRFFHLLLGGQNIDFIEYIGFFRLFGILLEELSDFYVY